MLDIERSKSGLIIEQGCELQPTTNRVLVLGSSCSGAYQLGSDLQAYLKERGIPNPDVKVLRDAGLIEIALLGREDVFQGRAAPLLPKGVILLPEMRQYYEGMGMSLDTYRCGIDRRVEELCAKYNVPLIMIRTFSSPDQISAGIRQLLSGS